MRGSLGSDARNTTESRLEEQQLGGQMLEGSAEPTARSVTHPWPFGWRGERNQPVKVGSSGGVSRAGHRIRGGRHGRTARPSRAGMDHPVPLGGMGAQRTPRAWSAITALGIG